MATNPWGVQPAGGGQWDDPLPADLPPPPEGQWGEEPPPPADWMGGGTPGQSTAEQWDAGAGLGSTASRLLGGHGDAQQFDPAEHGEHAAPPDEPHPDNVVLQSKPGELRKQSDRDPTLFEDYSFALVEHEGKMMLQYWDDRMPKQKVELESRLIMRIIKGFDESQYEHTKGAIGLQLNYSLFPSLKSREKHLRIKFTSIAMRSQWLSYLIEETGKTPEDPHDHLHVTPTKADPAKAAQADSSAPSPVSPPPGSPGSPSAADGPVSGGAGAGASTGGDSSDDEYQVTVRRGAQSIGWDDDESSDSVIAGGGSGGASLAARREVSPAPKSSSAWWQDKQLPPWELEASYHKAAAATSPPAADRPPPDAQTVRSEVATMQVRRVSRKVDRQMRPENLAGGAQFERVQHLDAQLNELRRQRQQRMSQRLGGGGGGGRGGGGGGGSSSMAGTSYSSAGGLGTDRPLGRSSRLAGRHTMPPAASSDYHVHGVQGALSQDLQNVRAKKAELEAKLATMHEKRASRSMRMGAGGGGGGSSSSFSDSTMMKGEGSFARVRAKRLHISLSAGPEYAGMSAPTKVLFDPTISTGAFDRLLRCVSVIVLSVIVRYSRRHRQTPVIQMIACDPILKAMDDSSTGVFFSCVCVATACGILTDQKRLHGV
jgi:hypothetical protein